jgi:histidyl-tRNA synthetase
VVAASGAEVIPEPPAEVVVLADPGLEVEAAEVARLCRASRTVAVDYEPRSLRAKMRSANKLGARWVVLLGEADARRNVAQLKEMASGEQVEVPWKELAEGLA